MRKATQKTFLSIAIACVAVVGFMVLNWKHGALSSAAPVASEITQHPDFDVQLLRRAAAKYNDPNDINNIPDEIIIEDFINIAFSDHDWSDDYPWLKDVSKADIRYGGLGGDKWARRWVENSEKTQNNRLAKFEQDIHVYFPELPLDEYRAPAYSHLNLLLDQAAEITGLSLQRAKYDPYDNKGISGILLRVTGQVFPISNPFKRRLKSNVVATYGYDAIHGHPPFYEHAFVNAVRFTPDLNAQVEGYLLYTVNHTLAISVCNIWRRHAEATQKALSTECLFRSLGLPDPSILFSNSILGSWNASVEPLVTSKDEPWPIDDSRHLDALVEFGAITAEDVIQVNRSYVTFYEAGGFAQVANFYADRSAKASLFSVPTKYDELILHILYNPRLRSGMSPKDARRILPKIIADTRDKLSILENSSP